MWGEHHMIFPAYMWIFWILIIAGVVALVIWIIRQSGPAKTPDREDALDILKKRYARGEIDKKEFEERKRDLMS